MMLVLGISALQVACVNRQNMKVYLTSSSPVTSNWMQKKMVLTLRTLDFDQSSVTLSDMAFFLRTRRKQQSTSKRLIINVRFKSGIHRFRLI